MNAKSITLAITFAAIAIALTLVRIPAVFYPGNFFQISQIPVVVAFLLFGGRVGVFVGVLNLVGQLELFPLGAQGVIVYSMDFVSVLIMFAGLYVATKFVRRYRGSGRGPIWKEPIVVLTGFAVAFRAALMPLVDYGVVAHVLVPLFIGISRSEAVVLGLVPFFVIYNVIAALYTVPAAFFVATRVGKHLKIEPIA